MHPGDRRRIVVLKLSGPFHDWDLPSLRALVENPRETGCKRFVLNLREVGDVSDAVLGFVLKARKDCAEEGGDLVLAEPSTAAREALDRHALTSAIRTFPDNQTALRYFRKRGA